jgi:putative ABC transport system permease protein
VQFINAISSFFSYLLSGLPQTAAQGMIWGIMAIGVFITFKILDIADLTVDGSIVTGAAVCVVLFNRGVNLWVAILVATAAGLLCGLCTGLLHTVLGIPPILAGILTQQTLWTVNLVIGGKPNVAFSWAKKHLVVISSDSTKILTTVLYLAIIVAVVIAILYWFFGTELGASLRATGNNLNMSRAQGINTSFTKVLGLAISNGIVALAGALLSQYSGAYDINMGRGAIVIGLAAVVVGDALVSRWFTGFIPRLIGVVLGGIVYFLVYQIVLFFNIDPKLLKMLSAVIIATFLGVPYLKKKYFKSKKKEVKANA